ncbi:hypothetical protein VTK26DRAFT_2885 [Humicola hyalothermophila]
MPPSSPRLPSPPPPAEIQFGPKSPLMGPIAARQTAQIEQATLDTNAKRRIHPGTRSADMAAGPPLVPLHELDSAFQLQEHLAALHYYHTTTRTSPITRETAMLLATPPPGIDKTLWLYELCRFLIAQCNSLIVGFLFDTPPCSASTCPEMRASEWQFLCAVHDSPKSCCAIDYCCHTLDWAANVVTNPKIFPSRFVVDAHDRNTAIKNLVNVFRRLHRIFAHAWFQHRGVFWSVEGQTGLYIFFKTVCDVYDLLPAENYKLPPEAEGLDSSSDGRGLDSSDRRHQQQMPVISIAKPPSHRTEADDENYPSMSRTNTRRHIKSSPSTGSAVTTVPEADEDDDVHLSNKLGQMRISGPPASGGVPAITAAFEDLELNSIPVMVEHGPPASAEQPIRPSSVVPPAGEPAGETRQQEVNVEPEIPAPEPTTAPDAEPQQPQSEPEPAPEQPEPESGSHAAEPQPEPEKAPPPEAPEEKQQAAADEPPATGDGSESQESDVPGLPADSSGSTAVSPEKQRTGEEEEEKKKADQKDEQSPSSPPPPPTEPGQGSVVAAEPGSEPVVETQQEKDDGENETGKDDGPAPQPQPPSPSGSPEKGESEEGKKEEDGAEAASEDDKGSGDK